MTNKILWLRILAIVFTFGMTVVGCDDDPQDSPPSFPSAKGKLTITGLDNFNDKYVYAYGLAGDNVLFGLTDITGYPSSTAYKLAKISGGKTVVPLYTANSVTASYSNSFIAYSGNDSVLTINIIILNDDSLSASNVQNAVTNNLGMKTISSGTFSNGNMDAVWEWSPPQEYTVIELAENRFVEGYASSKNSDNIEQWLTFTATAATQYIHAVARSLYSASDLYIQLYDNNGNEVGKNEYFYPNNYLSRTVTLGQRYYIRTRCLSYSSWGSYWIAFSKSSNLPTFPPEETIPIQLTAERQPANGYISTAYGSQFFIFTATKTTQTIHFIKGTLGSSSYRMYDYEGKNMSSADEGFSNNNNGAAYYKIKSNLLIGKKYCIEIYNSFTGSFQLEFY